jgi:hypothetical protein
VSLQVAPGKLKGLSPQARERFRFIEEYLQSEEPGLALKLDAEDRSARIRGRLPVDIGGGITRDFKVEFRFEGLDPFAVPEAWDLGRRFPPDSERHVEEHHAEGWKWCLWLPHSPEVNFSLATGIKEFIDHVRGFIFKQHVYEDRKRLGLSNPWPGPAWGHGTEGHIQWLAERLGSLDGASIERLKPYLSSSRLAANKQCPCGSGQKAGECHKSIVDEIRAAMDVELVEALDALIGRKRTMNE